MLSKIKIHKIAHFIAVFIALYPIYGQNENKDVIQQLAEKSLVLSKDYKDVKTLVDIMGDRIHEAAPQFLFVPSINPLNPQRQKRISDRFGDRFHPIDKKKKAHLGIDISAPAGTPIHATANGKVVSVGWSNKGYGNQVYIQHKFGFATRYAHMFTIIVKKGQKVSKGDIIGFVGSSGKSTGHHIHYEVRKDGKPIDPYPFCFLGI